ncbi:MAG: hypothetical protein SVO01_06945 [Thermotogota bacterium]|nr:hypothetical protein [Thermotogota bacterium]
MNKKNLFRIFLIGLSLSLISCGNSEISNSASYPVGNSNEHLYLDNEYDPILAYPSHPVEPSSSNSINPDENTGASINKEIMIPTPKANSMVIHGKLMSNETNQILPDIELRLATIIPVNPGTGYIVSTNEDSPKTYTNDNGEFLFADIDPDDYVLILNTPFNSYPIVDIDDNHIEIYAGVENLIDLGTVYVYWP